MRRTAISSMFPGGSISSSLRASLGLHAAITSNSAAASECRATGLRPASNGSPAAATGSKFKQDVRRYYGSFVWFDGRGEMIPNDKSFCEIDPLVKDKWGIPVLRFHWQWSEHELKQAAHMQRTFADIIEAMGGRTHGAIKTDGAKAIAPGGSIIHEVGGTIMGADSKDSVTNQWCQTWDVDNLFIADGGVFASNADKNPTLTIMALAWRAADHILERMRRKEL